MDQQWTNNRPGMDLTFTGPGLELDNLPHLISHTGQYDVAIPNTSHDNNKEVG